MELLSFLSPDKNHQPTPPNLQPVEGGQALATEDKTIAITSKDHLEHFRDEFGLSVCEPLPSTYREIDKASKHGFYRDITSTTDTSGLKEAKHGQGKVGLDVDRLKGAIAYCSQSETYTSEDFTLWEPDHIAPYVLESNQTPEEWLIYCENDLNTFFSKYGVTKCDKCNQTWDGELLRCPECGKRPSTVTAQIQDLQASHDGVVVMLSPSNEQAVSPLTRIKDQLSGLHQRLRRLSKDNRRDSERLEHHE